MKTKHTLISVLMILAIVTTLCVVMAAPASAAVSAVTVTPVPSLGGGAATYTIAFTTAAAVPAGGTVTVLFPAGTTVPASIDKSTVSLNGATPPSNPFIFTSSDPTHPTGVQVTHTVGFAAGANTLIFTATAGILNPATVANTYTCMVYTSAESGPGGVASAAYAITADIYITPTMGPAGTPITVVGGGFAKNTSVDIIGLGGTIVGSTVASATGTISTTVTASAATNGAISAKDGAGNTSTSSPAFTLLPSASATPTEGLVTTKVTVTGSNFTNAVITGVTFQGTPMTVVATEALLTVNTYTVIKDFTVAPTGSCTIKLIPPATATAGPKSVAITNAGGTGTAIFTITGATVTVTPGAAAAGATVVITGTGFAASQPAGGSVTFRDAAGTTTTVVASVTTGVDGSVAASFAIPALANPGTATVTVTDFAGRVGKGYVSVSAAAITLSPAVATPGTIVTMTGTGFPGFGQLTLGFDGANISPVPTVFADGLGNITATFMVPASSQGQHMIQATVGGVAATALYTNSGASATVSSGLNSITGKYSKVWSFDAATQQWKLYDTAAGATSTLTNLSKGQGYWIQVSADCTIIYGGNTYPLKAGWNLIGWLG